ncbi:hypothetical protein MOQ33_01110 [Escherichia coli]|uniref:hypothetical protein n=1 Tax=Escherichia coli TaxID=562 RepID=UPI0021477751|nr:hypothetical protein [Escherichia coli]MCR1105887.1 hypothetical protein [Escherichia coli]MDT9424459.1 hypothetical protein [Escherichia coli]
MMAVLTPRYFTFVCGNKPKFSYSDDIHRMLRNRVAKALIALISERYGFGLDYPKEGGRLVAPLPPNDHPIHPLLDTVILPLFTEQTPLTKSLCRHLLYDYSVLWEPLRTMQPPRNLGVFDKYEVSTIVNLLGGEHALGWRVADELTISWGVSNVTDYDIDRKQICLWEHTGPTVQELLDMPNLFYTGVILGYRPGDKDFYLENHRWLTQYGHTLTYPKLEEMGNNVWCIRNLAILPDNEHFAKILADKGGMEDIYSVCFDLGIACVFRIADVGGSPRIEMVERYRWAEGTIPPDEILKLFPEVVVKRINEIQPYLAKA